MSNPRLSVAGLLLAGAVLSAAAAEPLTIHSDPDLIAAKALGARKGTAVAGVWRDGAAVYGHAEHDAVAPPQPLYEIGSISKVFTGLLLAQAVERGDFALDDNLGQLLKGEVALHPEVAAITLRQLVTHSSCLPRMPANFKGVGLGNPYAEYSRADMWSALADLKLPHAAPCAAEYSNLGFALVGELLSRRYGKPWEQLVRENITGPLGMRDTQQHLGDKAARLAAAYRGSEAAVHWDFQAFAGAGSLTSSAADMLTFSRAIMAGKSGPLGAAVPRMLQPLGTIDGSDIGYGIMMRGEGTQRIYTHGGATGGYRADWIVMPDVQQAMVVMASNGEAPVELAGGDILQQRFKIAGGKLSADKLPLMSLPDYAGVYRVDDRVQLVFVAEGGALEGRLTGQPFHPLTAAAADVFTFPNVGAEFTFSRENGKVTAVTLRQRGVELKGRRTGAPAPAIAHDPALTQPFIGGDYVVDDKSLPPMRFEVMARDGQLLIRLNEQPMLPVFPVAGKADRYASDVVAAEFQFERGADGRPSVLVLHQNGKAFHALRQADAPLKADGVTLYLRGSMNDWGLRDKLQLLSPGVYTATVKLDKGDYEFKLASEDWQTVDLGGTGKPVAAGMPATLALRGDNLKLSVSAPASYQFRLDLSQAQPSLSISAAVN